jgi:hypothetical protein
MMMLNRLRIVLAATLMALAAMSAVDGASAAGGPASYDCGGLVWFGSP